MYTAVFFLHSDRHVYQNSSKAVSVSSFNYTLPHYHHLSQVAGLRYAETAPTEAMRLPAAVHFDAAARFPQSSWSGRKALLFKESSAPQPSQVLEALKAPFFGGFGHCQTSQPFVNLRRRLERTGSETIRSSGQVAESLPSQMLLRCSRVLVLLSQSQCICHVFFFFKLYFLDS